MHESENTEANNLVDHLFRHEAGKMVAVLTRLFGFRNIEQAEDVVHDTLLKALETWKYGKLPENPQAWLYKTAKNKAIDLIRREQVKYKIDNELAYLFQSEYTLAPVVTELFTEHEIKDSQLRMMFACCHPSLSQEAQITLMLKTLCGLSAREIGNAFLSNEDTITKRLYRTKEKIRTENFALDYPGAEAMALRIEAVLKTLYLLFNEGYNSSHPQKLIREDLCEEAMRLTILLTDNAKTNLPQVNALLALMCYQVSRFNARLNEKGYIVLLKDQDRTQWNRFLIEKGNYYVSCSAASDNVHEYQIEAAVASIHANSPSYEETDWTTILSLYTVLLKKTDNPIVALNRCLVYAEVEGYEKAIAELEKLEGLEENCYYYASLAELYLKTGNKKMASQLFTKALAYTSSFVQSELLARKLQQC